MSTELEAEEKYVSVSSEVISPDHGIIIRYHLFQDDHEDDPLEIQDHCYIVFDDKRHRQYLVAAIITNVDTKNRKYTVQRINDNQIETYHWHQIVVSYEKNKHSINIEQHNQKIIESRDPNKRHKIKKKTSNKKGGGHRNKRKRKRISDNNDNNDNNNNNNNNNHNINNNMNNNDNLDINTNPNEQENDDEPPNKKRKLNDSTASNINITINNEININHNDELQENRPNNDVLCIAQPYFPIPHPYFRQNALIKWKGKQYRHHTDSSSMSSADDINDNHPENPDNDWDVGRIVDFDIDSNTIYIQNTYRCGTRDDELNDLFPVSNWDEFVTETDAEFISHCYLYQLKQPILYWWDRPGCGSVCEDTIESLDYGADNNLIYGITGGTKKAKKRKKEWNDADLKWCHKDGIFEPTEDNKVSLSKYITRNYKQISKKTVLTASDRAHKLFDCIIIGGGMAGLTCRWALDRIDSDYKIKILEAQDYIGGRLKPYMFPAKKVCDPHSLEQINIPQCRVELGAAFLSGSGRDNRFWNWLKKNDRHFCADWGGYNNGWWNGDSFIDSDIGKFVGSELIENIKNICDDIQILCCKLLMPLNDMAVIDGLEYLKCKIPPQQLFGDDMGIEKYFYCVYDKYKILSANWVGPQGLWQQQQTVELQNLDFEALYIFLKKVFNDNKKGKKWLNAVEKLIIDYYGERANIKTLNFNRCSDEEFIPKKEEKEDVKDIKDIDDIDDIEQKEDDLKINGDEGGNNGKVVVMKEENENGNENEEDSEATESENDHSVTLSPMSVDNKNKKRELPKHVNWDEIIKYDVSEYGEHKQYHYKFGFQNILVRDIIHPPMGDAEAIEFEKTTCLKDEDYQRFKEALEYLADCNLFSYHLYFLRGNEKYKNNEKVKNLLSRFSEDLDLFDNAINDFKNILNGKKINGENTKNTTKTNILHYQNRKRSAVAVDRITGGGINGAVLDQDSNNNNNNNNDNNGNNGNDDAVDTNVISLSAIISGNTVNNGGIDDNMKKEEDEEKDINIDTDINIKESIPTSTATTTATPLISTETITATIRELEKDDSSTLSAPPPTESDILISSSTRKRRKKKDHKRRKHKKSKNNKCDSNEEESEEISEYEGILNSIDSEFKQCRFDRNLSLNHRAELKGDGFVTRGYSQVLEPFIVDISDKKVIDINHQVTSIQRVRMDRVKNDPSMDLCEIRGVDLLTGKPFCIWSKFVAVSVPLGILKLSLRSSSNREITDHSGIIFKPSLSKEKCEAIESMGMGCENKVYLRFTECFWPTNKPYFQSIQHPEYRFINLNYDNFNLDKNTNILCTMIPPTMGRKWYTQNPAQQLRVVWDVLRVLNQMFMNKDKKEDKKEEEEEEIDDDSIMINGHTPIPTNIDNTNNKNDVIMNDNDDNKRRADSINKLLQKLVDYKVTDWEHNIFTRGSYSYLPKGAVYTHCKALQKYDGNGIYFCGEAVSIEGFECVDGAHETGFNVAKQIHQQLQKLQIKQGHNKLN